SVRPDTTVGEVRTLMAAGHTRYPVIADEDSPVGVVELIDVLRENPDAMAPVSSVMRPAVVLPTSMLLPVALDRMRRSRNELACVVDEYGNFDGILTIEDLTEEVIGELSDEHDVEIAEVTPVGDSAWTVPGDLHLDELERLIGLDLADGDVETAAGLVIEAHGDLPGVGTVVRVDLPERTGEVVQGLDVERWLEIEVAEVDRHVPSQLVVRLREQDRSAAAASDEEVAR
ncbi:CBS domain-containing protein, partial [Microbacterium sp. B19]|uniref:CBS domain-containing protein n=1 Tax=Microbacterium sp. B19 TaxID=96765 RepID=UPI0003B4D554